MVTRCGGWSARRSKQATSRRTAPKACWWTLKKTRSRGVSGMPSRAAMRSSSPLAPDRGAGPSARRRWDYGGAAKLVEAAEKHVVRRYLMLSSMGAGDPGSGSEAMQPYLFAKARADERVQESDLDYTIIRPGSLTEEEGAGRIEAAEVLGRRGEIPREDVARTFAEALEMPNTYRKTFEIIGGETPIREALERI